MEKAKIALITGASSGLGVEFAKIHASQGHDLILVARRKERLEELKETLHENYHVAVQVICMDLSLESAANELYQKVKNSGLEVTYLINNAGFGGRGLFYKREWENDRDMIQLNVLTLAALTRYFLEDMIKRNEGKILNVGSVAGFFPGPLHATYYASKAFVMSFSEALNEELSDKNVSVTVLCPGATETEFSTVADTKGVKGAKLAPASAYSVALEGYRAMMAGKSFVVTGFVMKCLVFTSRLLPRFLVTKISRMMMEK